MAEAWQYIYSGQLLILFLLAQMAPIFFEVWMEAGLRFLCLSFEEFVVHSAFIFESFSLKLRLWNCMITILYWSRDPLQSNLQAGIVTSTLRLVKQVATLSPIMFIFQAKAMIAVPNAISSQLKTKIEIIPACQNRSRKWVLMHHIFSTDCWSSFCQEWEKILHKSLHEACRLFKGVSWGDRILHDERAEVWRCYLCLELR